MRKFAVVFMICTVCFLSQCVNNLAGGTSSSENGIIAGVITDANGAVQPNTRVLLIPELYNPLHDRYGTSLLVDTTNSNGEYLIQGITRGTYNIQARHLSLNTQLFIAGITVTNNSLITLPAAKLQNSGALRVFVPDTIDTNSGYVYIEGTTFAKTLQGGALFTGNQYAVFIDSVPSGILPPVILVSAPSAPLLPIVESVTVFAADTTDIGTDTIGKPIWRFPLIIGATAKTVQHYNGMDSVLAKVKRQVSAINNYFNAQGVFKGFIEYRVDSIYEFSASVEEEVKAPIGNFALRIIYDQFGLDYLAYWRASNRVLYIPMNVGNGDDLFTDQQNKNVTWGVGLSRGCPAQTFIRVDKDKNKINGEQFFGSKSMMNSPLQYQDWDMFSIHIINYHKNNYSTLPDIINSVFPSSMGVKAQTAPGLPVSDVKIDLFGVKWASYAVTDTPLVSGVTDSAGEYKFKSNPFKLGNIITDEIKYGNYLIRGISAADTAYTWMPVTDVGNAWFENPNAPFRAHLVFQKKREE